MQSSAYFENNSSASCSAVVSTELLSSTTARIWLYMKPAFAATIANVCLAAKVRATHLYLDLLSLGLFGVLEHTLLREELLLLQLVHRGSRIFCAGCIDTKEGLKSPYSSNSVCLAKWLETPNDCFSVQKYLLKSWTSSVYAIKIVTAICRAFVFFFCVWGS